MQKLNEAVSVLNEAAGRAPLNRQGHVNVQGAADTLYAFLKEVDEAREAAIALADEDGPKDDGPKDDGPKDDGPKKRGPKKSSDSAE